MQDSKVKMIAEARFMHDGVRLHVNDEFDTTELNAADLVALQMARRAPGMVGVVVETVKRVYRRRDLVAE